MVIASVFCVNRKSFLQNLLTNLPSLSDIIFVGYPNHLYQLLKNRLAASKVSISVCLGQEHHHFGELIHNHHDFIMIRFGRM
jgi:hypothetical protein